MFAKLISIHQVELPSKNYKGIINFTSSEKLMREYGFEDVVTAYDITDGTTCYFSEGTTIDESLYTLQVYPSQDYEWNSETKSWQINLDKLKDAKKQEIRFSADAYSKQFLTTYSDTEQRTWTKQEKGMNDLVADIESQTEEAKWVRSLAETRGIELSVMIEKIKNATEQANQLSALIVGTQQKLEDQISNATTEEEVRSISWNL